MRFCDEQDFGFGWMVEDELVRRTSHALVADGGVWLVDPVEWPEAEERAAALGELRGVITLLDRHERDAPALAARLGVPHHAVPERLDDAPFEVLPVLRSRWWSEVALWWPAPRVLVCADALGTLGYFRAPGERIGVHPFLRLRPPRSFRRVFPEHVLTGHGAGVHDDAAQALHEALRTSRRRLPAALWNGIRRARRRPRGRRPA
jgi:glyoxylase-like metal-dependent hydrolase (beta-lactamase superfamily II)